MLQIMLHWSKLNISKTKVKENYNNFISGNNSCMVFMFKKQSH